LKKVSFLWSNGEMGMEIKRSNPFRGVFGMKICKVGQGTQDFLAENPFIFIDQDKLKGLILTKENHPLKGKGFLF